MPSAEAATRSIQFSSIAHAQMSIPFIENENIRHFCTVVVANTGATDQKITAVTTLQYDGSNDKTVYSTTSPSGTTSWSTPEYALLSTSSAVSTTCIDATMATGGACLIHWEPKSINWKGNIALCAGKISVADVTASSPGAVSASGSIAMYQEAKVMGGVLSGAYYSSGAPVDSTYDDNSGGTIGTNTGLSSGYAAAQMNILCSMACMSYGSAKSKYSAGPPIQWDANMCNEHCGASVRETLVYNRRCYSAPRLADAMDDSVAAYNVGGCPDKDIDYDADQTISRFDPDNEVEDKTYGEVINISGFMENHEESLGTDVDYSLGHWPANNESMNDLVPTDSKLEQMHGYRSDSDLTYPRKGLNNGFVTFMRTANPQFAGGMVFEMVHGAFRSVCSGNADYFDEGGIDHVHGVTYNERVAVGTGDNLLLNGSSESLGARYYERLHCAHRHAQDDLFLKVGSTTSFTVNGGIPF